MNNFPFEIPLFGDSVYNILGTFSGMYQNYINYLYRIARTNYVDPDQTALKGAV